MYRQTARISGAGVVIVDGVIVGDRTFFPTDGRSNFLLNIRYNTQP
jgi:hypothetical protein